MEKRGGVGGSDPKNTPLISQKNNNIKNSSINEKIISD